MELNIVVKKWFKKCKQQGYYFAQIITPTAIFDRVAIIDRNEQCVMVEYPRQYKRRWQIKLEAIQLDKCKIRYYKD